MVLFDIGFRKGRNQVPRICRPKQRRLSEFPGMSKQSRQISKALRELADPEVATHSERFFKTGMGEYGEGDRFLGIRVPDLRSQLRHYPDLVTEDIHPLLQSTYHEERLLALLELVREYRRANAKGKAAIYRFYLANTDYINNWDLVDSSAAQIIGAHLENRNRRVLY